jgi:UDP-N-acetylglucosamine diphosphorylase/glucosamine-1-phosphate N-acetyltransferase
MQTPPLAVIIMAAGQGKRMNNPDLSKVMHPLAGTPLIEHVTRLARRLSPERIVAIVGHCREQVIEHLTTVAPEVRIAVQDEQLGTGHAIMQTREQLEDFEGDVVILSGDAPLTRPETLDRAIARHRAEASVVTVLTALLDDPTGYGRVVRDEAGHISRIVEHKDASDDERAIREINSGIYVFRARPLFDALSRITNDNVQGEYYLTDVFELFRRDQLPMIAEIVEDENEIRGINTIAQLQDMEAIYARMHGPRTVHETSG